VHVHQHKVRPKRAGGLDRSFSACHLTGDVEAIRELYHAASSASERGLIADDQNLNGLRFGLRVHAASIAGTDPARKYASTTTRRGWPPGHRRARTGEVWWWRPPFER